LQLMTQGSATKNFGAGAGANANAKGPKICQLGKNERKRTVLKRSSLAVWEFS